MKETSEAVGREDVAADVAEIIIMISDEALMLEFQGGSHPAFEQLFARYRGPLYGFFRRRLDGDQRAEDLTQETFVAVIRASAQYEPRALFRTYLYSIAMNLLAAERRKRAKDSPQGNWTNPNARS
jgi:DNA-directed RNA polymerase specialized sigma24 family protein